tara:strand:- start:1960 stop:3006 length:1047 start_codon:yes stop_codon:yes gene_type:complete
MLTNTINPILLKESYVKNVLGFTESEINSKKITIYNDILEEHIRYRSFLNEGLYYSNMWSNEIKFSQDDFLNEGLKDWINTGIDWVKDNAEEALSNVKDLAYDGVDAIKDFGKNSKAIIIAITAIIQDENELKAYKENIYNNIKDWPENVLKHLKSISDWMSDKNIEKITGVLGKIGKTLEEMWSGIKKITGWMASLTMIVFGLCVKYIEENFKIKSIVKKTDEYFENPKKVAEDFVNFVKSVSSNKLDLLISYFTYGLSGDDDEDSEIMSLLEESELQQELFNFLAEKLEFLEKIKEKFIDMSKNIAGSALQNIAGPIAWLKSLIEFFGNASWVISNIASLIEEEGE